MSAPVTEPSASVADEQSLLETPPTSVGETSAEDGTQTASEEVVQKPLPTKKDFPALGSGAFYAAASKVSWGPNMNSAAASKSASQSPSPTPLSVLSSAKPARSKTIQEAFSLDLQSQLSMSKLEFSRIIQSVKQAHGVSVESTLSKTSRTFLISGAPEKVKTARRDIVKKLTKPITATIEVPSKTRAAIIGSGGKTIREISGPLDVKINVAKDVNEDSFDEDLDDYNVEVTIHGDLESVKQAEEKILAIVKRETKNASVQVSVQNKELTQFINLDDIKTDDVITSLSEENGNIVLSGDRDAVKAAKATVLQYLESLSSQIKTKKVKIPVKFQFLINNKEIKDKFNVIVRFPSSSTDEEVSFIGKSSDIEEAISHSRESSKHYVVESLEISKAHGKNVAHAKNIALYFEKYNVLNEIKEKYPDVRIVLPTPEELKVADSVLVRITAKSDAAEDLKNVRKEVINLVNELTTSQILAVTDLDYDLFHQDIKKTLEQQEQKARFLQLGDYYPGDDTILLIAQVSQEDFRPSDEELKEGLDEVNSSLDTLRKKQSSLSTKTFEISAEVQDSLFAPSCTTRQLIDEEISVEGGHVQFKMHNPTANQVSLRGDDKAVAIATKAIDSIISNPSDKSKLTFGVPSNSVPRLIGTKGANLNAIREKFNCSIDIAQDGETTTDATVVGLLYNAEHAKTYIIAEAKKWADIISKDLLVPSKFHGRLIGSQGAYRNRLQTKYSVHIHFPNEGEGEKVTIRGPSRGVSKAYDELKALLDFEIENGHKSIMKVPTEHVARIIGKNGDMINDIRADSGVELDFLQKTSDAKAKETGEVELEITGSRQAIKEATKRVEEIIKEASDNITTSFEVNPNYIKDIVGAGGRVLKDLISKAGGDEIRNKSVEVPNADSEDKHIVVQGPKAFVDHFVKEVKAIIDERENSVTKEIDVPKDRQGALIGPAGSVRRQLESEFRVRLEVPDKGAKDGKVTISGLPANIEACEKKIFSEIIRNNYDAEVKVPSAYHEFVSERGALIQRLRSDFFVNVKFGNANKVANKLVRVPLVIPAEKATGTAEEGIKFTTEEISVPESKDSEFIPWRLSYEPVDLSDILTEEEPKNEPTKEEVLEKVKKLVQERIELAPKATTVGYVWSNKPQNFRKVVGPMGSNIKRIREATGALISVPKKDDKINDVIYIRGTKEGVEKAADLVIKRLKN
ncbi:LAFE_0H13256g1_1 [Lachancea fermentati]|uniref:LAFE_0H13256g1_1 n=1 Tax=Lachancea fermentati TaxID=4955 RepID=A0A1G4MKX2_LACFM|nr:LAFE_0H13256g1_1 [Lachancea fermentati]